MTTLLIAMILTLSSPVAARDPAEWFLTKEGKPTERLIVLLSIDNLYNPNDDLEAIVKKTQEAWVKTMHGKGNIERTDLQDSAKQKEVREKVEKIAQEIGLFDERKPLLRHYKYGACLGALLDGVRQRLHHLITEWQQGVRFDSLVFFTGERYLRKETDDSLEKLLNPQNSPLKIKEGWQMPADAPYETEYDMCKLIWDQTELPPSMREALKDKVVFVDAKRPQGQERVTTKDCYVTWLNQYKPEPGSMLAPSHPLIWPYQQLAGENALGKDFFLDTIANKVTDQERLKHQQRIVSLVQDTAAKCIFELSKRKKD